MKTVPSKFSLLSEIVYTANFLFIATLPSISSVRNRALKIMRWQQRCATLMNGQGVTDSCFSIRVILPDGNPSLTFLRERYFSAPYSVYICDKEGPMSLPQETCTVEYLRGAREYQSTVEVLLHRTFILVGKTDNKALHWIMLYID